MEDLEQKFGAAYADVPGRPPWPTRLMAGLASLKHTLNLSDERLCERWVENPYNQLFCGEEFLRRAVRPLVDDALAPTDGEKKIVALSAGSWSLHLLKKNFYP